MEHNAIQTSQQTHQIMNAGKSSRGNFIALTLMLGHGMPLGRTCAKAEQDSRTGSTELAIGRIGIGTIGPGYQGSVIAHNALQYGDLLAVAMSIET